MTGPDGAAPDPEPEPGADRAIGVELGRWQTGPDGRFVAVDGDLRALLALPLVPVDRLGWEDLVLPGTDLSFLARGRFERCAVDVGLMGGVRRWALTGRHLGPGRSAAGSVEELLERPAPPRPVHP